MHQHLSVVLPSRRETATACNAASSKDFGSALRCRSGQGFRERRGRTGRVVDDEGNLLLGHGRRGTCGNWRPASRSIRSKPSLIWRWNWVAKGARASRWARCSSSATRARFCTIVILPDSTRLLVETAEDGTLIDVERAIYAKERAQRRLDEKAPELDINRAKIALAKANNRLKISRKINEI